MNKKQLYLTRYSLLLCSVVVLSFSCFVEKGYASILTTRHNFSKTGPGPIKAVSETGVCVFCHTPHRAASSGPLWNRDLSSVANYTLPSNAPGGGYEFLLSTPSQPDGDSRLCLSCHDGTVAIGSVVNLRGAATTISMQAAGLTAGKLSSTDPTNFGTNLSGHHPVSIEVNDALLLAKEGQCTGPAPANTWKVCKPAAPLRLLATANLYGTGTHTHLGVQCSSCHDPHEDPVPGTTMFLRVFPGSALGSDLCSKCHYPCGSQCPQ